MADVTTTTGSTTTIKGKRHYKPVKKRGRGGGRTGGRGGSAGPLFDPNQVLSGRKLKRASKKLTAIELVPSLRAYGRQAALAEANRAGAEAGLYDLGRRTGGQVAGAYGALKGSSDQTVARQQALAQMLNQDTSRINNESAANLQGMQTGQLGGITESLKARNVDPGGSAAQAALAQQAQAQQQQAAQSAEARGAFASAQGGAFQGMAAGQAQAGQMRGAEAQTDIANLIANRIAESNMEGRANVYEALGKRADTKALWGPTRVKNLLQLRGSEREWIGATTPKKNINVYKGLGKGKTAAAQVKVAQLQKEKQQIESKGLGKYGKQVGGGGGGRRRRRR